MEEDPMSAGYPLAPALIAQLAPTPRFPPPRFPPPSDETGKYDLSCIFVAGAGGRARAVLERSEELTPADLHLPQNRRRTLYP